jgi:hypothetical protein
MFVSWTLAQRVWHHTVKIIWRLFAKRGNLGPWKSFTMIQCLYAQPLSKTLKCFNHIWFFLSGLPWIIRCQQKDSVFNALQWLVRKKSIREELLG